MTRRIDRRGAGISLARGLPERGLPRPESAVLFGPIRAGGTPHPSRQGSSSHG